MSDKPHLKYGEVKQLAVDIVSAYGRPPYTPTTLFGPSDSPDTAGQVAATRIVSDFAQHWLDNKTDPIVIQGDKT